MLAAMLLVALGTLSSALAADVVVQGNKRVDTETIRSYFNEGSVDEGVKSLQATGMFSSVRASRRGSQVVVTVSENNIINRVVFEGNRKVQKETLEPEVQSKARGAYNPATVEADAARIREIYKRTGRGLAQVQPRVVDLPNGRVDVVFTVTEGDKTGVREIVFTGNQIYSSSRLRGLMTTTEMNFLSWFKTSDIYDPDRIASDLELIRRYYLKNGYADFRIVSSNAEFDAAGGGYVITVAVEEGNQYRVSDVRVDSRIADVDPAQLQRRATTAPGEIYNAEAVEKTIQNMTNEVARRGYAFAQVRPSGQRNSASNTIALAYVVEEGPRVYIERINLRGNTRTRDYVIRREFDLGEGDAYNKVLIDRAERRLNNLGYFKKVRITNEPGSSPDRVVVNVDLEDQPTGSFSVSGGYSTADGFIGEVALAESNFLGRGQYVRLAGSLGQRSQGAEFSFTEPYFLGYRMSGGFDVFSKYTDETRTSRYENRTTGFQLRLGLPFTEEFSTLLRYSLYQTELKIPNKADKPFNDCTAPIAGITTLNADKTARFPDCAYNGEASVALKEAAGTNITSLFGLNLTYNTLDNVSNPRSGFLAELRPDVAGAGGDSRFFRAVAEARYYHELSEDFVGILKAQAGHIQGFGGHDLRIVDHFFLGPSLVRGFAPSGLGPRDQSVDPRSNALGGTTYFGGTAEVQFPIFGLPRDLGLKGAVFADAGTLFGYKGAKSFDLNRNGVLDCARADVQGECINVLDKKTIRSSVGASVLWQSPLGPIRFDYAFALSKADGDRTQAFRFSGGTKF